jgi:membrane associated rhomboid family serine protease
MTFLVFLFFLLQSLFLFPIKDRRERQRTFPWATASLVLVNVIIHIIVTILILQQPNTPENPPWTIIYPFMEVPALILNREGLGALSVFTSGFLHGSLSHLLGNMFVLWFFGRKVEDSTGPLRFAFFYILCLFTASLLSVIARASLSADNAWIPGLGASGAIAGVMAAYLFLYSEERILTLFSAWLAPVISLPGGCFIPLPIPVWLPAWVYIVYNFLNDAIVGQLAQELSRGGAELSLGVNVFAHLGGAAGGFIFILFFLHPDVLAQRR